ncbi:hypothetical protein ACFVYD_13920 [Streptomyces sp. NPDC058301]|uniref:hypothetical protein n=1 Tax=Streptomyces sp. NPDC058301 TaxID=3346436 RepID=UPI0036EB30EC
MGERGHDEGGDGGRVDERRAEHHAPLAVTVGGAAQERAAGGLPEGERAAREPGGGQAAAGLGDQQHTAELAHRRRQPSEERDGGEQRPGEGDDLAIRVQGSGHQAKLTRQTGADAWLKAQKPPDGVRTFA